MKYFKKVADKYDLRSHIFMTIVNILMIAISILLNNHISIAEILASACCLLIFVPVCGIIVDNTGKSLFICLAGHGLVLTELTGIFLLV